MRPRLRHRPRLRRRVSPTRSAVAWPSSTATTTARPDLYLAGGATGGPLPQREPGGRRPQVRPGRRSRHRPDRRDRRLSHRHRRRRTRSTSRSCASARTSFCAASVTAGSSGPTSRGASTVAMLGRPPSARHGRAERAARRSPSATTVAHDDARRAGPACVGQRARPTRRRRPSGTDAPIALTPGWCTLSMLFSDWDRSGRRDLRDVQRPPLLRDQRRRGTALAHRHRASPPRSTRTTTAGPHSGSGAWASPATTSPATAAPRST